MPKFEFRFDIATILLASVLTVLNLSAAEAGRKGGGATGEFRSGPPAADAVPTGEGGDESEELNCEDAEACLLLAGRKGGSNTGEFRTGSGVAASSGQHARPEQQVAPAGGFIRTGGARGGVVQRFGR
jgi:hypothetical protein